MSLNIATKFIRLTNCVELYTERITSPSLSDAPSSTIILIHGLTLTVNAWYPMYNSLIFSFPSTALLAYDWSGGGISPVHPSRRDNLTFTHLIEDLDALITSEIPTGPITILAHSAGSLIATQFLLSSSPNASRVTHAIFIGGPLEIPVPPAVSDLQYTMADSVEKQGWSSIVDSRLVYMTGPTTVKTRPIVCALMRAITVGQSWEGTAYAIRAFARFCQSDKGTYENIPKGIRKLIIGGDEDSWFPKDVLEKVAGRIGAGLVMLEKVGQ